MADPNKRESLPSVVDPEVDAVMQHLDAAVRSLVEADVAAAKAARNSASAALIVARHKRSGDVHRKAVEVKLRAEARLGQLAGPALEGKAATAAASAARAGTVSPADTRSAVFDGLDRQDIARCRKVYGASDHLSAYLSHISEAGEEPTRAGFLSFAKAREDLVESRNAQAKAAEERKKAVSEKAKPKVIDTTAVVTSGRMDNAGSKPAPLPQKPFVIPPPKGAPERSDAPLELAPQGVGVARAARWAEQAKALARAATALVADAPERLVPEPLPDGRLMAHGEVVRLVRLLEPHLRALFSHIDQFKVAEQEFLVAHAKRAKEGAA